MKAQASSGQQAEQHVPGPPSGAPAEARTGTRSRLTEDERRVLDCLKKSGGSLTERQLQARCSYDEETLDRALTALVGRKLVARLNTIIPSYTSRVLGSAIDDK